MDAFSFINLHCLVLLLLMLLLQFVLLLLLLLPRCQCLLQLPFILSSFCIFSTLCLRHATANENEDDMGT